MNAPRFDRFTHILAVGASRRGILRGLASAGLGAIVSRTPAGVDARKKRAKKLQRNSFGCVDVGLACRGNSDNCCSGICQGKKPKKGKPDRSKCMAHGGGICPLDQEACAETPTTCGPLGVCGLTTGKACFCAAINGNCAVCRKDADCVALWGAGSACLVSDACPETGGTYCAPLGS